MDNRIKESFDSLPIAVCFFDMHGLIRLINHRMLATAAMLRKDGIQTLTELQGVLHKPPESITCISRRLNIYQFPDGTTLRFSFEPVKTRTGSKYIQATASDVTKLMQEQRRLKEENNRLAEANERLLKLYKQMPELIREKETLELKQRVHDDIGHSILAARRALIGHLKLDELKENASLWEESISVLYRSNEMAAHINPMEIAIKRAAEMGVSVVYEGTAPDSDTTIALAALAIRECAANCVRHADATILYVSFTHAGKYIEMTLSNNGNIPEDEIHEGGGLSMLRHNIEKAGGSMQVQSLPSFKLMLKLPE